VKVNGGVIRGADDPAYVRSQYEDETGLRARKAIYSEIGGIDARQVAFDAVREVTPARVLEVGCGEGELAERLVSQLGVELVALDQSERMVELARARGVDSRVGDVQQLPFEDGSFDVAVAAWMLYHVPDLERALRELARVLRPGGRLVAVTNYANHLSEMFNLVGLERWDLPFGGENGAALLAPHFSRVDVRDGTGTVVFPGAEPIRSYLRSSARLAAYAERVPELDEPLLAHRRCVVFVADKSS
jgi:SAM-dependent methyltransferase